MSAAGLQGLRPWLVQRISAAYIALFLVYLVMTTFSINLFSAANWRGWVAWPGHNIAMGLFIISILWHAWIGVRDVILDYVGNVFSRLLLLTLVALVLLGSGLWGIRALILVMS